MKVVIYFSTENDAYVGNPKKEVDKIVKSVSAAILAGEKLENKKLIDTNGNTVGDFSIDPKVDEHGKRIA